MVGHLVCIWWRLRGLAQGDWLLVLALALLQLIFRGNMAGLAKYGQIQLLGGGLFCCRRVVDRDEW